MTKIFNGAIEDAALDKRDGAQRAVAGWVAGQSGKPALDCPPHDPFTGLSACRGPLQVRRFCGPEAVTQRRRRDHHGARRVGTTNTPN